MKLCPYPFSRVQTTKGAFFPCCPSWFNEDYLKIEVENNLDDVWNGKAAVELRRKMYEGDFSLCNREVCQIPLFTVDELANSKIHFPETPIAPENIEAIKRKDPVMPGNPSSLHLASDLSCNLSCPTCRPQIIPNSAPSQEAQAEYDFVHRLKDNVEIIKMSSGGEVFYSQLQRSLIKSFNPKDFPKLQGVHIISNGTLFNQKTYDDLSPGTSYIRDVSISIDAGSKEVYEKIRGPYWDQVLSNLEWLGEMRKTGKIEFFTLNFTLIRDNYRDIPNIIEIGKKFNVDRILIQKYLLIPGQGYKTVKEQEEQAVHLPNHPEHIHMIRTLEKFKDEPILYTFLNIPGFDHKITEDVNINKASVLLDKAETSLRNQNREEAFTLIQQSIEFSPLDRAYKMLCDIYFDLGIREQKNNDLNKALENFSQAMKYDSKRLNGKSNYLLERLKGLVFSSQMNGQFSEAHIFFNILSSFTRPDCEILYSIGLCFKDESRIEEAEIYFKKVIDSNPKHLNALLELGFIEMGRGRFDVAAGYFRTASEVESPEKNEGVANAISSVNYYRYRNEGFLNQQKGFYSQAIEMFNKALRYSPGDADLYFSLAISLKRKKRSPEAVSYFSKVLASNPQHYWSILELGFIELAAGKNKSALDLFLRAQKIEPLDRKGNCDKYIMLSKRANRLQPLKRVWRKHVKRLRTLVSHGQ